MELRPLTVLVIDDEANIRKTLAIALESDGHDVIAVANGRDAAAEASRRKCDAALLDMRLGTVNGLDVIPRLLDANPWLKIIVITAHATIDTAVEAMRRQAFDYLAKPFSMTQLRAVMMRVAEVRALEEKVHELEGKLGQGDAEVELRSHSPAMRKTLDLARNVAPTDASVLITGENGTGKTLLARAIHGWSRRAAKPFGTVSCPSLSADLLESELFGHAKGAFTGAVRANPGRIATCQGGTLFLDEIGDMPLPLQAKLLRFLQDKAYEPLGDAVTRQADVRVIAATNAKLREAVAAGKFREDLYYRLNVIRLELPPLRERAEDVVVLAERFLAILRRDKPIVGFSEDALARLRAQTWPGNIRELRNVIERAVILCPAGVIEARHLAFDEGAAPRPVRAGDAVSLDELEEQHVRRIVASARSMEEAARVLGIDAATLWRRRKKYGI